APEGAQGRGPGRRPAHGHASHLPGRSERAGRAARLSGPVLEPGSCRLQRSRRAANAGGFMSEQATATAVQTSIVVDAPIDEAFSVFTEGIDTWGPREYTLLDVDIAERVFEPRVGGQVYDRGTDGSECHWARVLAYE